ncbi:hypothetical protein IQ260_20885 [Leptolyngbya cf. ectocarpi LEGE 11479]|uniref:Calcium-binding protein n=1 Tax=Leptolyngbya cf. ectocarpi LEGE 11479 TaxID=1828722 RepID=A0A928ZX75_LEPEC|nr:hypothetical protein [Leptolyngbya ectocarpi]MBE9069106.1 hypothetical protein [Leptolyngbya cf. ectocarpi LEGE 11479]
MAQLTGFFQGTSQADTFLGKADTILIDDEYIGISADVLVIDSFGGDDIVEAITNISTFAVDDIPFGGTIDALGIGMTGATVDTGRGSDTFTASSVATSKRSTLSIGLRNSDIKTKGGHDSVLINGTGNVSNISGFSATGIGMRSSVLKAGAGNDTVTVNARGSAGSQGKPSSLAIGLESSSLGGNRGEDVIQISASAVSSAFIAGGTASATGIISDSYVSGGADNDTISITASTQIGTRRGGGSSKATGVGISSVVWGGKGSDKITIAASTDAVGTFGAMTEATGVLSGLVEGNGDNDTINITAEIKSASGAAVGINASTVSGGAGSDEITIGVKGFTNILPAQNFFGALESHILGGSGNDTITIESTYTPQTSRGGIILNNSIGLVNSALDGGSGDDILTVSGLNLDLKDAVVFGGGGEDIFDTGVGSASISGGGGQDILKLDFFDTATMSITQLGTNSIHILGTQDKQGNSLDWTQTINGVEHYEVAGALYNATDVVALLG